MMSLPTKKACHTVTKAMVEDNEKGLNESVLIDVTEANQINANNCSRARGFLIVNQ